MVKLIDILKESLKEGKQVGIVYHFTDYESAKKIIDDGLKLKVATKPVGLDKTPDYAKYVSFTRNKDMRSPTIYREVRFKVDGDAMSNRYKVEPYADTKAGFGRRSSDEAEERIDVEMRGGNIDISPYLMSIEIMDPTVLNENQQEYEDDYTDFETPIKTSHVSHFKDLIDTLKEKNIPFKIVKSYLKERNISETDALSDKEVIDRAVKAFKLSHETKYAFGNHAYKVATGTSVGDKLIKGVNDFIKKVKPLTKMTVKKDPTYKTLNFINVSDE